MNKEEITHIVEILNILDKNEYAAHLKYLGTLATLILESTNIKSKAKYNKTFKINNLSISIRYN